MLSFHWPFLEEITSILPIWNCLLIDLPVSIESSLLGPEIELTMIIFSIEDQALVYMICLTKLRDFKDTTDQNIGAGGYILLQ